MQASSYTPSDAQVLTHIAFVAEFSLTCSNGASNVALYADLNGALVPVVRSQDAGGRFVRYLTYSTFTHCNLRVLRVSQFQKHLLLLKSLIC